MGLATKIAEYKASKATLFWTALGSSVVTAVVGFSALGWVSADTAAENTKAAIQDLRVEFASKACLDTFLAAEDAHALQAELAALPSYKAEKRISELGWVSGDIATNSTQKRLAGRNCWNELKAAELPEPVAEVEAKVDEAQAVLPEPAPAEEVIVPEISEPTVVVVPGKAELKPEITLPEVVLESAKAE